jgi:hypothetical protein
MILLRRGGIIRSRAEQDARTKAGETPALLQVSNML